MIFVSVLFLPDNELLFSYLNDQHPPLDFFFFLNIPAPPEISPLPLHAALPISGQRALPGLAGAARRVHATGRAAVRGGGPGTGRGDRARRRSPAPRTTGRVRRSGPRPARPDRKSTRLNSSHLVISYAVFCLKKK